MDLFTEAWRSTNSLCFSLLCRPHLRFFFSWMRGKNQQGGSWADKFHVKDDQVWLYKHKTSMEIQSSPDFSCEQHMNNTITYKSINCTFVYTWLYLYITHTSHTHLYIYIYTYTNFVLLLWDLSNCGIKPANANEITLCLYSFKYVSFLRGLKQLGVIGTSRTAYFLRNGKLAAPMQHALQLSADIPTAVWWQPEQEFWTNTTTTTLSAWLFSKNGLHNIV